MTEDKSYVGALSVKCGCPVCSSCLVLNEVLFIGGSEISPEMASKQQIRCVFCNGLLVEPE
jgi:hypothetical protein